MNDATYTTNVFLLPVNDIHEPPPQASLGNSPTTFDRPTISSETSLAPKTLLLTSSMDLMDLVTLAWEAVCLVSTVGVDTIVERKLMP